MIDEGERLVPSARAASALISSTADAPSSGGGVRRGDRAVAPVEHRFEPGHLLERRIRPDAVSCFTTASPGFVDNHGTNLGREPAVGGALGGKRMAAKRPAILRLAGNVILLAIFSADWPSIRR